MAIVNTLSGIYSANSVNLIQAEKPWVHSLQKSLGGASVLKSYPRFLGFFFFPPKTRSEFILRSQQRLVLIGKVLKRSLPLTAGFFSFLDNLDEEEDERSLEV